MPFARLVVIWPEHRPVNNVSRARVALYQDRATIETKTSLAILSDETLRDIRRGGVIVGQDSRGGYLQQLGNISAPLHHVHRLVDIPNDLRG